MGSCRHSSSYSRSQAPRSPERPEQSASLAPSSVGTKMVSAEASAGRGGVAARDWLVLLAITISQVDGGLAGDWGRPLLSPRYGRARRQPPIRWSPRRGAQRGTLARTVPTHTHTHSCTHTHARARCGVTHHSRDGRQFRHVFITTSSPSHNTVPLSLRDCDFLEASNYRQWTGFIQAVLLAVLVFYFFRLAFFEPCFPPGVGPIWLRCATLPPHPVHCRP